jgi:hypothetical protein
MYMLPGLVFLHHLVRLEQEADETPPGQPASSLSILTAPILVDQHV